MPLKIAEMTMAIPLYSNEGHPTLVTSPPLSQLDEIKPFIFAKFQIDVCFLCWSHSERTMLSNEIIVKNEGICYVLGGLGIVHATHDLSSLFEGVVPSFDRHVLHAFLDGRHFQVFWLRISPSFDFLLYCLFIRLQGITDNNSWKAFCLDSALSKNVLCIVNVSGFVDLGRYDKAGIVIHQVPEPIKVAPTLHSATPNIDNGLVNMPDSANIRGKLGNIFFHDFDVSLHPVVNGRLPDLDTVKLHKMVSDLAIRHPFEVQIHAKCDNFGILFHSLKTLSVAKLVMADKARQTLNLAEFGVTVAIFFELDALAFRTTKNIVLFLIENWITDLYLLSHLQRKLHGKNMLANSVTVNMIRTRTSPCKIDSVYIIVKFTSLRTYLIVSRIDSLEHVFVLGYFISFLLAFRKSLAHYLVYTK